MATRIPGGAELLLQLPSLLKRRPRKILIEIQKGEAVINPGRKSPQAFTRPLPAAATSQLQSQLQPQQIFRLIPGLNGSCLIKGRFEQRGAAFGLDPTQQFSGKTQTSCCDHSWGTARQQTDHSLLGLS